MKLRVRSLESKETLKIEVPNSCTLQQFKLILSQQVSSSSSSSSVSVSLNRKDELSGSSLHESLESLGVTSGDLIFYSILPNASAPLTLIPNSPNSGKALNSGARMEDEAITEADSVQDQKSSDYKRGMAEVGESLTLASGKTLNQDPSVQRQVSESDSEIQDSSKIPIERQLLEPDCSHSMDTDMDEAVVGESETLNFNTQKEEITENMDINNGSGLECGTGKRFHVPCYLGKVLRDELADDGGDHRLLVIAVHAVLLESGFVGFHLPDEWASTAFTMSLRYTLPDLINSGSQDIESVVLKFQRLGQFINVYGSLGRKGSRLYRVCLDEYRFAPTIDLMWAKGNAGFESSESNEHNNSSLYPESEVFEFWKIIKDGLALPLLIDICDRAGLPLPSCFMQLPTELKLKILELLPGVDLAKVGCVCLELRSLSSMDDLWKQKFMEEVRDVNIVRPGCLWKSRFASWWERRKERKRPRHSWKGYYPIMRPFYFPVREIPGPFVVPSIRGGDYDLMPDLSPVSYLPQERVTPPTFRRATHSVPRHAARRTFGPNCNLGGFNS